MEITIRLSRPALIVFLILALTLGLTGSQVLAQPPAPPNPSPDSPELMGGSPVPGGPGYVSLSHYDFVLKNPNVSSITTVTMGLALCSSNLGTTELYAPIQLPQGAIINKLVVYLLDNNEPLNITAGIHMHPLLSNEYYPITEGPVAAGPVYAYNAVSLTNMNAAYSTVNNSINSYLVYAKLPSTSGGAGALCLAGVRVDYGYPSSLPLVVR